MRAAFLFSSVAFAGIVACPSIAAADLPGYADLPGGHATAPPESAPPNSIPAHEKVPGFFVATPSFPNRFKGSVKRGAKPSAGPSYVMVVATADRAKRVESGNFGDSREDEGGPCFSQEHNIERSFSKRSAPPVPDSDDEDDDDSAKPAIPDWSEGLSGSAAISVKTENNPNAGVTAVHSERFVNDGGSARIEIVDAWVDPATKGVRKIASSALPLKLLGSARGLEVYAAREEREKTNAVHFVVVPSSDTPNGRAESLVAMLGDGRNMTSSSCSHLRFALAAGTGAADSALLRTTLRLPDREAGERSDADGEKRARVREAAVQLGISQTKRDAQPILSLTFGWAGRETTQVVRSDE